MLALMLASALMLPSASALMLPFGASSVARHTAHSTSMYSRASLASMCDAAAEDKAQQQERMEQELEATRAALKEKYAEYYGVPNGPSAPTVRAELKAQSEQMESDIVRLEAALLELQGGGALKYSAVGRMRQKEGGKKDPMSEDYDGDSFTAKVNKFFDDFVGGGNK